MGEEDQLIELIRLSFEMVNRKSNGLCDRSITTSALILRNYFRRMHSSYETVRLHLAGLLYAIGNGCTHAEYGGLE